MQKALLPLLLVLGVLAAGLTAAFSPASSSHQAAAIAASVSATATPTLAPTLNPKSNGQTRYLTTSSTQTSYQVAAAGRAASLTAALGYFPLGQEQGEKFLNIEISPFGEGADNATFNMRVYLVETGYIADGLNNLDFELVPVIDCVVTLSTALSVSNATVGNDATGSDDRLADTVTITYLTAATSPAGVSAMLQSVYGSPAPQAYSPANNTPARIYIPDCGGAAGVLIDFDLVTATSANCLIKPGTRRKKHQSGSRGRQLRHRRRRATATT